MVIWVTRAHAQVPGLSESQLPGYDNLQHTRLVCQMENTKIALTKLYLAVKLNNGIQLYRYNYKDC